jgi:hypothetical protein
VELEPRIQSDEDTFLKELRHREQINLHFELITTITQPLDRTSKADHKSGHFIPEMLTKWLPDLRTPISYLAGPTGGVTGMRPTLNAAGVVPDDEIRTEDFAGY